MPRRCWTPVRTARSGKSGGNLASPLLAEAVGGGHGSTGGAILLAFIAAVAFATILAVVAGLTLTSASSVAHDLYANVIKKGVTTEKEEIRVARIAAFVIGGIAIVLAIPAQKLNIAFLVALAFAVAASANLPAIIYNLFWRRFNTRGATWSIYGGLISAVVLVFFSPVVSGKVQPTARAVAVRAGHGLLLVPAGEPGHHLDPARLLLRLARHRDLQGRGSRGQVRRAGGPGTDRRRSGEGHRGLQYGAPTGERSRKSPGDEEDRYRSHTLVAGLYSTYRGHYGSRRTTRRQGMENS